MPKKIPNLGNSSALLLSSPGRKDLIKYWLSNGLCVSLIVSLGNFEESKNILRKMTSIILTTFQIILDTLHLCLKAVKWVPEHPHVMLFGCSVVICSNASAMPLPFLLCSDFFLQLQAIYPWGFSLFKHLPLLVLLTLRFFILTWSWSLTWDSIFKFVLISSWTYRMIASGTISTQYMVWTPGGVFCLSATEAQLYSSEPVISVSPWILFTFVLSSHHITDIRAQCFVWRIYCTL